MNSRTKFILLSSLCISSVGMIGCGGESTEIKIAGTDGSACEDSSQCGSGLACRDGECVSDDSGENGTQEGILCGSSRCRQGEICDTQSNRCIVPSGGACGVGISCADGLRCNPQKLVCQKAVGLDEDCSSKDESFCAVGICDGKKCMAPTGEDAQKLTDSDGDGISDYYEIGIGEQCGGSDCSIDNPRDSDGDTIPDYLDLDSNGDGIPDVFKSGTHGNIEKSPSSSNPNITGTAYDYLASDSDGNGIPDTADAQYLVDDAGNHYSVEVTGSRDAQTMIFKDSTGTVIGNGFDPVTMQVLKDGVPVHGVFVHYPDLDGDGTPDFMDIDTDGDGIEDMLEIRGFARGDTMHTGRGCDAHCAQCEPGGWCAPGSPENPWDTDGDTVPDYRSWDSDGDTIPDSLEIKADSNDDGILDRYSLDSDGDTIPDAEEVEKNEDGSYIFIDFRGNISDSAEKTFHKPMYFKDENGQLTACFQSVDCDRDSLPDNIEVWCGNKWSGMFTDTDGDGFADASEYTAAQYVLMGNAAKDNKPVEKSEDLICNAQRGVKDIFDFYFELPDGGEIKNDDLVFKPEVSKLDVVFDMDTTKSMGDEIKNLREGVRNKIVPLVQKAVADAQFGVTKFADFPYYPYGYSSQGDMAYELLTPVTDDVDSIENAIGRMTVTHGEDYPEAGFQSLWQIMMGDNANFGSGKYNKTSDINDYKTNDADHWGGVGFRRNTLPVITHITDASSHNDRSSVKAHYGKSLNGKYSAYGSKIKNPYYSDDVKAASDMTGTRVITVISKGENAADYSQANIQAYNTSKETGASVPACAFQREDRSWQCGEGKCCTGENGTANDVDPLLNKCVLKYNISGDGTGLDDTLVSGITALVKYGTYSVSAEIIGEPMPNGKDTSCFLKKVEASQYDAPPQEPEKSCNPTAVPANISETAYFDGFENFAPGIAEPGRIGAQLHFAVHAQNDGCIEEKDTMQIFRAYIDVVNPTTGLVFGRRQVSIIVPSKKIGMAN